MEEEETVEELGKVRIGVKRNKERSNDVCVPENVSSVRTPKPHCPSKSYGVISNVGCW